MTPRRSSLRRATGGPSRRLGGALRTSREVLLLGLPVPLLLGGLAVAAAIGLLLSYALVLTTSQSLLGSPRGDDGAVGNNLPATPVLTEASLGSEVQDLVDAGYVETSADFDVRRCLDQQGITDPVLIMEEVAWGPEMQRAWLIVHASVAAETLRTDGGPARVSVVLPTCGRSAADPSSALLWSGSTMLAPQST